MNKILSAMVCTALLIGVATQAEATLVTEWDYTLQPAIVSTNNFTDVNGITHTSIATSSEGSFHWQSGGYSNSMSTSTPDSTGGTFEFDAANTTGSQTGTFGPEGAGVVLQTVEPKEGETPNEGFLATLQFIYNVTGVDDPATTFDESTLVRRANITIPLFTYQDPITGDEFIYYSEDMITVSGNYITQLGHTNYNYGLTGIGLYVDGRALGQNTINGEVFYGWVINEDTVKNNYSQYDPKSNNNDQYYTGLKTNPNTFNIEGTFSFTATPNNINGDPTPTPEPTTILLMGLGLASIGFIARRRCK